MATVETDSPPKSPSSPDLFDTLQVSLKAAGIAGVFAVVGYIVIVAHGDFLGIQSFTEVGSVTQLSLAAGGFLFDSAIILLQQAQVHWFGTLAVIAAFGLLCWPHLVTGRVSERLQLASEVGIVAVLAGTSAAALVLYELPAIKLRDVMTVGLCAQPGVSARGIIDRSTRGLWYLILDSKGRQLNCPTQPVGRQKHEGQEQAASSLSDRYALTVLAISASWLLVYLRTDRLAADWLTPLRTIAATALIVSTLLIPYVYGKLLSPIALPLIQVQLQDKSTPARPGGRWLSGDNLLVAENDKSVLVLNFDNRLSQLLEIPRGEILQIATMDTQDALVKRIDTEKPVAPIGN